MRPIYLILGLLLFVGLLGSVALSQVNNSPSQPSPTPVIHTPTPAPTLPQSNEKGIQLKTITFPTSPATPTPSSLPACGHDQVMTPGCSCPAGSVVTVLCDFTGDQAFGACPDGGERVDEQPGDTDKKCLYRNEGGPDNGYTKHLNDSSCNMFCFGKPVIYLYPEVPTSVNVTLTIPGQVTISIPEYPKDGWKNILANPGGKLEYQGKTYSELYYESEVSRNISPVGGVYIPVSHLEEQLRMYIQKLGLKENEEDEYINYWMPKLTSLHSQFIYFSVLTNEQKEAMDKVTILPKPDTFIQFITYFKPTNTIYPTTPLTIQTPPKRTGFTAVEWGGTIDTHSVNVIQ